MEYLHHTSIPATKSELDVFYTPPTQTAIEGYYEVEYRPSASLDSSTSYDINIPTSDDFTDPASMLLYVSLKILKDGVELLDSDRVKPVYGFAHTLFEQVDMYLNGVNICPANNLHHYEAFLADQLFGYRTHLHESKMMHTDMLDQKYSHKRIDLYFKLIFPLSSQNKLLLNGISMLLRLNRASSRKGLKLDGANGSENYSIKIMDLALIVKRVRLYPDVHLAIQQGLEKGPARYFIIRNDVKNFIVSKGLTSYSFENVYSGILPRRLIVGFVTGETFNGHLKNGPFKFENMSISYLIANVNGTQVPSVAYTPDFQNNRYMREFYALYRYTNQEDGIPQMKISFESYKNQYCLFVFDLSPDTCLEGESGVLSLVKRGNIKVEVKFSRSLDQPIHMIVFGQFDNVIQIDKYRSISTDY